MQIARPKVRLSGARVGLNATAKLEAQKQRETGIVHDDYLPSGRPFSPNMLYPLRDDPTFGESKPRFPASRITRVLPLAAASGEHYELVRSAYQRSFASGPVLASRLRFSRPPASPRQPELIASLDIEVSSFAKSDVTIESVRISCSDGHVEDLQSLALPFTSRPQDEVSCLYRLVLGHSQVMAISSRPSRTKALEIEIQATTPVHDNYRANVLVSWKTIVDLATLLSSEELELADKHLSGLSAASVIPTKSITFTFVGPDEVYVGEVFAIDVFLVNRTHQDRKLAIVPRTVGMRADVTKRFLQRPPWSAVRSVETVAEAVTDEIVLYALQKSNTMKCAELANLTTDVRIRYVLTSSNLQAIVNRHILSSNLPANGCYKTSLRFLALERGVLNLDVIRVIDMDTKQSIDIRDYQLPNVVAVERKHGS